MKLHTTYIIILTLVLPVMLHAGDVNTGECLRQLRSALHKQVASDSSEVVHRVYTVTRVQRTGMRLDTTISTLETIEAGAMQMMMSDSIEIWSDNEYMIVLNHRIQTLDVRNLRKRGNALNAQRRLRGVFPDTLTRNPRDVRCRTSTHRGSSLLHVSFRVDTTIQRAFNAREITAEIDANGDARLFHVLHPVGRPLYSTEYRVDLIERNPPDLTLPESVLHQAFDTTGKLLPEYANYRKG